MEYEKLKEEIKKLKIKIWVENEVVSQFLTTIRWINKIGMEEFVLIGYTGALFPIMKEIDKIEKKTLNVFPTGTEDNDIVISKDYEYLLIDNEFKKSYLIFLERIFERFYEIKEMVKFLPYEHYNNNELMIDAFIEFVGPIDVFNSETDEYFGIRVPEKYVQLALFSNLPAATQKRLNKGALLFQCCSPDEKEESRKMIEEISIKVVEDSKRKYSEEFHKVFAKPEEIITSYKKLYNWLNNSPKYWRRKVGDEYVEFLKTSYGEVLEKLKFPY